MNIISFFDTLISFHIPEMRENWFNVFKNIIDNNELLTSKKDPNRRSPVWGVKKCKFNNGQVTGITLGSTARSAHPNLVISDDILGTGETNKYPNSYVENHVLSELFPTTKRKKARFVLVGTPLNEDDIYHKCAKDAQGKYKEAMLLCTRPKVFISPSGWACRIFPAILNEERREVLLPEIFSYEEVVQDKLDMGDYKWFREMQCSVRVDKSALISHFLFTKCCDEKYSMQEIGKKGSKYVMVVDPSAGEGQYSDYAAIAIIEKKDGKKILRYVWHERMLPIIDPDGGNLDLTHKIIDVFKAFYSPELYVENNNIGRVLIQSLRKEGVDPYEHETKSDKVKIMTGAIGDFKRDALLIIPANPECSFTIESVAELKKECLAYGLSSKKDGKLLIGGKGVNDDMVTAFLLALHYTEEGDANIPNAICQN